MSNIERYAEEAEAYLNSFPPDEYNAALAYEKYVAVAPFNAEVLGAFGELLCTASDGRVRNEAKAIQFFRQSIEIQKDGYPERYFYLAQCLASQPRGAHDATQIYQKGIIELERALRNMSKDNKEEIRYAQEKIAMAYCAVAELYMTELSDTENSESCVQRAYDKAIEVFPFCFDAHSGRASYYKTIGDLEAAGRAADTAMEILNNSLNVLKNGDESGASVLPHWNSQLGFAACLVDLNKFDEAKTVLDVLIEQDDRNVEVWHVSACCYFAAGALEKAEDCISVAKSLLEEASSSTLYTSGEDSALQGYVASWSATISEFEKQLKLKKSKVL